MAAPIDFPASPALYDYYAYGNNLWQFTGSSTWQSVHFGTPDDGVIDGGTPTAFGSLRIFNGGSAGSTYTLSSIDCGTIA